MFCGQIFFSLKYPNPGKREGRRDKYFETTRKVLKCLFLEGITSLLFLSLGPATD